MAVFLRFLGVVVILIAVALMGYFQYRRAIWWGDRQAKKERIQTLFSDDEK
jgi:hypothetical protein